MENNILRSNTRTPAFCNYSSPNAFLPNWMNSLSDDTLLTEMSIPGTHDSCALYGGGLTECNSWSILDQLKAGIRYLDLRLKVVHDTLLVFHGPIYQKIGLGDILKQVEEFFKENPSEAIIARIKPEGDSLFPKESFENLFEKYNTAFNNVFYFTTDNSFPKLKDIRSRIFVLDDGVFPTSKHFYDLEVQDMYDLNKKSIDDKKDIIHKYLTYADEVDPKINMVANHCSGTGGLTGGKNPNQVAIYTNEVIFDSKNKEKIGIIIMDFPGEELIRYIVSKNN